MIHIFSSGIKRLPHLEAFLAPEYETYKDSDAVVGWGKKETAKKAISYAKEHHLPYIALEDGFLRSVGLGVKNAPPLSILVDPVGVYYDASSASCIEADCVHYEEWLTPELATRAQSAIERIVSSDFSKYNCTPLCPSDWPGPDNGAVKGPYVLCIDQTQGDASVRLGAADAESFRRMLEDAVNDNPQATVLIKTHPDVLAGAKKGYLTQALEAIDLLKTHPQIFSESYLSPLNGTRLTVENGVPATEVTKTCLRRLGFEATQAGLEACILAGKVGVLADNGLIGELLYGKEALAYWKSKESVTVGSFAVNPAVSRFMLAQAKRDDGGFVVDAFSTDGGSYPRNVIVENGLMLVQFGALTLAEFVTKASLAGARALGLPNKGHLSVGADGDVTVLDYERKKAAATVANGKVIMNDGVLLGKGTTIVCDERGAAALAKRGISHVVKQPINLDSFKQRFVCKN